MNLPSIFSAWSHWPLSWSAVSTASRPARRHAWCPEPVIAFGETAASAKRGVKQHHDNEAQHQAAGRKGLVTFPMGLRDDLVADNEQAWRQRLQRGPTEAGRLKDRMTAAPSTAATGSTKPDSTPRDDVLTTRLYPTLRKASATTIPSGTSWYRNTRRESDRADGICAGEGDADCRALRKVVKDNREHE